MTDSITAATPQSSPPTASIGIEISPNPVPIASVTIQERNKGGWWNELLDRQEAKKQVVLSLPLILTNVYLIPVVSVMFAGHLGELELAAANLANSWATVTGFAFMQCKYTRANNPNMSILSISLVISRIVIEPSEPPNLAVPNRLTWQFRTVVGVSV
ncbi:hypothetical protein C1H46_034747 [Malus baccata]|uniref:MATE efflux family protein n=1 Tax=Malus baccata TaxID=106549 RepID=A0A540L069_MALBA|nr:hypothetical protein C1H46_034747 [Malus baccata]